MKYLLITSVLLIMACSPGCAQNSAPKLKGEKSEIKVGGRCEGCEAIYESPVALDLLPSSITLPDYSDKGPQIQIEGVVYKSDGKTPAADVVIYIYHTDQKGVYPTKGDEKGWAKRHGYIRGWMKTDKNGKYSFKTLRPASYPDSRNPQHIHVTIKEPGKSEYWIDEYVFDDDPYHTGEASNNPKGGSGVMSLKEKNGIWYGTRDIILGLNVADYPKSASK